MGGSTYSFESRSLRAKSSGYFSKSADQIFEQNTKRIIHESMEPKRALLRESRDSENHPNSLPIILGLDVTGSMGHIPHELIKDGLPNMVAKLIEEGILDPQILFLAIGDHSCDHHPLQVGQFESGDEEMDLWLSRTYIEKGGGANEGESYSLAWYFGANHVVTDAWEKRQDKGFIFTIGDEPCLRTVPSKVIEEIMGVNPEKSFTDMELLEKAREKFHVFHLHIMEGSAGRKSLHYWKDLMGENCIQVDHYQDVSRIIAETVAKHSPIARTFIRTRS